MGSNDGFIIQLFNDWLIILRFDVGFDSVLTFESLGEFEGLNLRVVQTALQGLLGEWQGGSVYLGGVKFEFVF